MSGLSLTAPADRAALGVEVCAVAAGSAAMAAGLRAGCRVLSINGSVVRAHRDGEALLRDRPGAATAARGAAPPLLSLVVTLPPPPRLQPPPSPPPPLVESPPRMLPRSAVGDDGPTRRRAPRAADRPSDDDDDSSGGGDSLGSPQTPRDGQADAVVVTSLDDV